MAEAAPSSAITLHAFPKAAEVPSASGFCQKLEVFFRVTSTRYTTAETYPHSSPTGKLPYATINGVVLPDSHFIIRRLVNEGISKNLDAGLTLSQAAEGRAWQALVEDHLYPCVVYERWCVDENYAVTRSEMAAGLPWPLSWVLPRYFRGRITGALQGQGVAKRPPAEVSDLIARAIHDLEDRLASVPAAASGGDVRYFHGTQGPSEVDVIVAGFLMNMLGCTANPVATATILACPSLVALTRRMTREFFPEYKALLEVLDKAAGAAPTSAPK